MEDGLIELLRKIAELHGRASEIGTRIRQEAESVAAVHRELSVAWTEVWSILNRVEAPPMGPSSAGAAPG